MNLYRSVEVPANRIMVDSITVTIPPTKTSYMPGESFDPTGMVVTASASGMTGNVVSSCTFSPTTLTTTGTQTVTIMYQGCTTTTTVSVVGLEGLTVTTEPTKTIYREDETLDLTGIVVTADYGAFTRDVTSQCTFSPASGTTVTTSMTEITISFGGSTTTTPLYVVTSALNSNSWESIKAIGAAGAGSQYFSVGDRKTIRLTGYIGASAYINTDLDVFIIHFNYRNTNGIYFQGFKTTISGSDRDISLVDTSIIKVDATATDGTKVFNMFHWGAANYGGWKGSDMRYDILGSTNIPPSDYGSIATDGRVGYDATEDAKTNPVPRTLMSCLPSDLRSVLAPWTVYPGVGGKTDAVETCIDYLTLPANYEATGIQGRSKSSELSYVSQFSYYSSGGNNSWTKKCYIINTSSVSSSLAGYYSRSARAGSSTNMCYLTESTTHETSCATNYGIAPCFRVA